ncbi:MAG: mammalian cell entry protein [Candidatus Sericytochromatia bacterium]
MTDTGETTDDAAGSKTAPARGVPVGKRSGRHRYFRARPAAAPTEPTESSSDRTSAAIEITETAAAEAPIAEAQSPAVEATDEAAKPKRRKLFGRRSSAAAEEPLDDEPEFKPAPKQAGKRIAIAVVAASVLFVGAGAFGGAMLQPYLSDRAVAQTKLTIARTAADAITTLFTYTPQDVDQLPARSAKYLGGDLRDAYAKQVDALAATNKQNQIQRSVQVVGTGIESLDGPDATAVVYANITYNSAQTKEVPRIFLVSYRLSMKREGDDWVITNMPWITSKDLTRLAP